MSQQKKPNKVPVKYENNIIGYTNDNGRTIQLLDTDFAKIVKENILNANKIVSVSARSMGALNQDGTVESEPPFEYVQC